MEPGLKGTDSLTRTVRQGLVALLEDSAALNVSERAEAGRVLGRIGDNRKGVGLNDQGLPDIDWIKIPPGEIVLGHNAGTFPVESFYLGHSPITNAQFQCFIDDPEGYANPRWWAELDAKPGTPEMPSWHEPNHPREMVSWFEAMGMVPECPANTQSSGSFPRVVHGGSWILNPDFARASARYGFTPDDRSLNSSFRVCCVSPI